MIEIIPEMSVISLKHARVLRGPHQVAFDITNRCNYRCLHCYNRSGENLIIGNELNDKEVLAFIKDIADLKPFNVCFCGGEPMLREELIYKGANILAAKGVNVSMVTNGSLITPEKAKKLLKEGVNRVQVSVDGASPESHEKLRPHKGAFESAINAIMYFKEAGYKDISVAFAPTRFNWMEIEETYHLCVKVGATNFRVQPLMILGRAQIKPEEIVPTPLQYRETVRIINKLRYDNCVPIEWGDPVDHLIRFRTICEHCVNFANVKADGSIQVSPYLPLVVGNVRRHKFREYWEAGLARIWEVPIVKKLAARISSIVDFGKREKGTPTVWFDEDIEIDIIDDNPVKEI
ncbi:MAG: radical SAM protein [candidate division WOR-3 bacterium]